MLTIDELWESIQEFFEHFLQHFHAGNYFKIKNQKT